jgi:hypothetical protein
MKRLLILVGLLAGLAALSGSALSGTAAAAAPCRDRVFNDWYHDGKIASSYPVGCYRDALKHIPADARIYSSLATDINAAMRAALGRQHGKVVPKQVGHGFKPIKGKAKSIAANGALIAIGNTTAPHDPSPVGNIADTTSKAPLPILVLGGIAIALAAAGAIGTGVRYARRRPRR